MAEHTFDFIGSAKQTIRSELDALADIANKIGDSFAKACELIMQCNGRVVVTGIGKSGHIAKKIAATLASTGTPSFFVHPAEASHGDLGMITKHDLVLVLSNSGNSPEILSLLPVFARRQTDIISVCGNHQSPLAKAATINLDIYVAKEACPLDLAPTTSTTAQLVMGDAIAVALLEARGFTADDFAHFHPGGALGKRLLLRVGDVMRDGEDMPCVNGATLVADALAIMSQKGLGMTAVIDDTKALLGVFTDGDLRRCMTKNINIQATPIKDVMTPSPLTVTLDSLAAKALTLMEKHKVTTLIAADEVGVPKGVIHMHDLLREGLA